MYNILLNEPFFLFSGENKLIHQTVKIYNQHGILF